MKKLYSMTRAVALRTVELLTEQKITVYELAKRADLNESTIRNIINERCNSCNMRVVERIAFGFNIPFWKFINSPYFDHDKFNN